MPVFGSTILDGWVGKLRSMLAKTQVPKLEYTYMRMKASGRIPRSMVETQPIATLVLVVEWVATSDMKLTL